MLALLIDENLNHRILRGLVRAVPHLDFAVAQDTGLTGAVDPRLLVKCCERSELQLRILYLPP